MAQIPTAADVRRLIEDLYFRGAIRGDDGNEWPILPMSVTPERGAFVRDMCLAARASSTLEIGMAWGLSTLHILEALLSNGARSAAHVVMDCDQNSRFHGAALRALREAGLDALVEFHEDYSELLLPRLVREGRSFDFVFIDGMHRFDNVFVDLFYTHRLLKPGGMVVLDDLFCDAVHYACRYVQTNYGYEPVAQYPASAGPLEDDSPKAWRALALALRKPLEEAPRGLFHFVPFFTLAQSQPAIQGVPPPQPAGPGEPAAAASADPSQSAPTSARAQANALRANAQRALHEGDRTAARGYLAQAIRLQPFRLKSYLRLLKTFLPQPMIRRFSASPKPTVSAAPGRAQAAARK